MAVVVAVQYQTKQLQPLLAGRVLVELLLLGNMHKSNLICGRK